MLFLDAVLDAVSGCFFWMLSESHVGVVRYNSSMGEITLLAACLVLFSLLEKGVVFIKYTSILLLKYFILRKHISNAVLHIYIICY